MQFSHQTPYRGRPGPAQYGPALAWASLVAQMVKASAYNAGDPWVWKIPWRRERLPTPIFWPGEFHGLYSPWASLIAQLVKKSACNVGDPSLIPGPERSSGEETGYPLHYSWASLVAQLVKNLPVIRETWVQSLGWKDPLENAKATHSSILAWRSPWNA